MRTKVVRVILLGLFLASVLTLTTNAKRNDRDDKDRDDFWSRAEKTLRECFGSEHHEHNVNTPLKLVGAIAPPRS